MQHRTHRGIATLGRRVLALLAPRYASEHQTDYDALNDAGGSLDSEYRRLVSMHLQRWGVNDTCATVEIQQLGSIGDKEVFVANICLTSWDRNAALRVLLGLPLLDQKIRKAVDGLWLADVSIFRGVVLKVSDALHAPAACAELRHLIVSLTGPREVYGDGKRSNGHRAPANLGSECN